MADAPMADAPVESLSVKELRSLLRRAEIDTSGCIDKADLRALAAAMTPSALDAARSAPEPAAVAPEAAVRAVEPSPPKEEAAFWSSMSAGELKKLLRASGVSVDGCLDRADLLERAGDRARRRGAEHAELVAGDEPRVAPSNAWSLAQLAPAGVAQSRSLVPVTTCPHSAR